MNLGKHSCRTSPYHLSCDANSFAYSMSNFSSSLSFKQDFALLDKYLEYVPPSLAIPSCSLRNSIFLDALCVLREHPSCSELLENMLSEPFWTVLIHSLHLTGHPKNVRMRQLLSQLQPCPSLGYLWNGLRDPFVLAVLPALDQPVGHMTKENKNTPQANMFLSSRPEKK